MTDNVVGSAAFELRASTDRLVKDLSDGKRQVEAGARELSSAAKVTLKADTAAAVTAIQGAERQMTASLDRVARAHGQVTAAAGLNRLQVLELTHVTRSFADSVIAGQNPVKALALEMGRLQVAASAGEGGFVGLGKSILGLATKFISPAIVGIGALGAAFVGLFAIEQSAERSQAGLANALKGIGAASGATVADLNRIAEAQAAAGNGSVAFAKQAEQVYLRVGLTKDQLAPAIGIVQLFAAVSGKEAPQALDTLAKALEHPAEGAKALGDGILNLSAEQIRHIQLLDEQGRRTEAVSALIAAIGGAVQGAKPHLTELGERFSALTGFIQGTINKLGEFLGRLVQVPAGTKLAQLEQRRAELVADGARGSTLNAVGTPYAPGLQIATNVNQTTNRGAIADIDRQIAALKGEIAATAAAPGRAQAAVASREQQAIVAKLNPDLAEVRDLRAAIKGAKDALKALAPGGPGADDLNASIAKGEARIKQIQNRGVKRGPRGPADTTVGADGEAQRSLDAATKDHAAAEKEAATQTRQASDAVTVQGRLTAALTNAEAQRVAARGAVQADLDEKINAIDRQEAKVRAAKNDAHKRDELRTLEHARAVELDAAIVRNGTADGEAKGRSESAARAASVSAIEQAADAQRAELQSQLDIARVQASFALTVQERLKAAKKTLGLEQQIANVGIKSGYDVAVAQAQGAPDQQAALARAVSVRAAAQRRSDAGISAQGQADARQAQGPLANYRDSLKTDTDQGLEKLEVSGLEGLTDNLINVATHAKTAQGALHDLVTSFLTDLLKLELKRDLLALLGGGGGGSGGGNGILGALFSAVTHIPAHASGTSFAPGGLSLVGENGPEFLNIPRGSQVLTNSAVRDAAGAERRRSVSFDLRGAVMTGDLVEQMQQIANATGGQVLNASITHTNATVGAAARRQAVAARNDLTRY